MDTNSNSKNLFFLPRCGVRFFFPRRPCISIAVVLFFLFSTYCVTPALSFSPLFAQHPAFSVRPDQHPAGVCGPSGAHAAQPELQPRGDPGQGTVEVPLCFGKVQE